VLPSESRPVHASMPGLLCQDEKDAIYVNLYVSSETSFKVGGKDIALSVESEMPWGGKSRITVSTADELRAHVKVRIPGWARNQPVQISLRVHGQGRRTSDGVG